MATRTSHSSPCFLRVADASAASSASKITSLSTPFSLETASTTIRISLFTVPRTSLTHERPSGRKPRFANLCKPHRHALAVDLERDAALIHREQHSGVAPPPGARLLELDEHPGADEAPEVRSGAQQPVESRRGHLQRVGARDRVLDVEERGHLAADALAVIEPDARLRVDVEPQERAAVARGVIELDELVPEPREQRLEQRPQALAQLHRDRLHRIRSRPSQCRKQKKGPKAHRKTKSAAGGFRSYLILGGAALSSPLRRATPATRPHAAAARGGPRILPEPGRAGNSAAKGAGLRAARRPGPRPGTPRSPPWTCIDNSALPVPPWRPRSPSRSAPDVAAPGRRALPPGEGLHPRADRGRGAACRRARALRERAHPHPDRVAHDREPGAPRAGRGRGAGPGGRSRHLRRRAARARPPPRGAQHRRRDPRARQAASRARARARVGERLARARR